jgi:nitroimidazol reductase NimA-like FMN-containing flavoprotein (pyridoxamine 5'-phosphate oxidase superfamily)
MPDGQPHVTPLITVWYDGALWFCTGLREQKARNLAMNQACTFTTGTNAYDHGLDVVMQGRAVRETNADLLTTIAETYLVKYGEDWRFEVVDGGFRGDDQPAAVFRVEPTVIHGFRRGERPSQTRWTFD